MTKKIVKTKPSGKKPAGATGLPKKVTEEPRNQEEMHLSLIKDKPSLVRAYLEVSDDKGEQLQSKSLEKEVVSALEKYSKLKEEEIREPDKLLAELKSLATVYTRQINFRESTLGGTICKYRIRQGRLFLIMKKVVKAANSMVTGGSKMGWSEWFSQNFSSKEFRSAQDAMRLAKAKNIIRYAVLGKFRLLQILRQIDGYEKQDNPVGAYLTANGVDFTPEEETDFEEVKFKADVAINYQKLSAEGITEIPKEKVEALIRNGQEVESKHLKDLKFLREKRGDLIKYFDQVIAGDNAPEPVLNDERKAEIFKKAADRFLKVIENAFDDSHYLGKIDQRFLSDLKDRVARLESLVTPN
jgi:hypothetical protein